jgi:type I restriction enzyme S subunit
MPQPVFDQLPTELVETDLGLIPAGWAIKPLGQVLDVTMGQSPPSSYYNERGEGLPFHQGVTDYGFRFPTHRVYCTLEARIAEPHDVLLSVRAPVGRINVADRRLVVGRGLAAVRHPLGHASHALYLLKHLFAEEDAVGDGTIYKAVTKEFLLSMPVLEAAANIVAAAEEILAPLDALIQVTEYESVTHGMIRDALLPKLISGEVRIESAAETGIFRAPHLRDCDECENQAFRR